MNGKTKGPAPHLDWQICESEAEWQQEVLALPSPDRSWPRQRLRQLLL